MFGTATGRCPCLRDRTLRQLATQSLSLLVGRNAELAAQRLAAYRVLPPGERPLARFGIEPHQLSVRRLAEWIECDETPGCVEPRRAPLERAQLLQHTARDLGEPPSFQLHPFL